MSDSVLIEIGKQIPSAVILFGTILVFLNYLQKQDERRMQHEQEMEAMRIAAAKEREDERRKHESEMNNMWAVNIKNIVDRQEQTAKSIADALAEHERASRERYEKMGITNDLLDLAKQKLSK